MSDDDPNPDMLDGCQSIFGPPPVRFGDRLRVWAGQLNLESHLNLIRLLDSLADEIDSDEQAVRLETNRNAERIAAQAVRRIVQQREDLRAQIKALVDEMRVDPDTGIDVIDADAFLCRLSNIFSPLEPPA